MFAYCGNNPANLKDTDGKEPITATMTVAAGVVTVVIFVAGVAVASYCAVKALWEIGGWIADLIQIAWAEISYAKELADPEPPDVTYPGDDPAKAPEGTEWKGKGEQGSNQGNYHNPETDESWHPDLDHPEPIGPHWDYRDPSGTWWRIGPGGTISLK